MIERYLLEGLTRLYDAPISPEGLRPLLFEVDHVLCQSDCNKCVRTDNVHRTTVTWHSSDTQNVRRRDMKLVEYGGKIVSISNWYLHSSMTGHADPHMRGRYDILSFILTLLDQCKFISSVAECELIEKSRGLRVRCGEWVSRLSPSPMEFFFEFSSKNVGFLLRKATCAKKPGRWA